jgi:hypothetical protein
MKIITQAISAVAMSFILAVGLTGCGGDGNPSGGGGGGGGNNNNSGGVTWTKVANSPFVKSVNGIAFGNGRFVAVGDDGKMAASTDGATWTAVSNNTFGTDYIYAIVWGKDKFVAGGAGGKMAYSTDGITWTAVENSTFGRRDISAIAWGNDTFVAVGGGGAYSADGVTWTASTTNATGQAIAFGDGKFVVVGGSILGSQMGYSDDNGVTWKAVTTGDIFAQIQVIAYGAGRFVAAGTFGRMGTSTDGITWVDATANSKFDSDEGMDAIAWVNDRFIATNNGRLSYSSDGVTWKAKIGAAIGVKYINAFAYGNGKYVLGDNKGVLGYSKGN